MRKLGWLSPLVILVGCTYTSPPTTHDTATIIRRLAYFRDDHTGLCFAALKSMTYAGYEVLSITNVPCDKVGLQ